MREKLIEEMIKEVYGPRNGSEEEIDGDPSKEYLTGVIISRNCRMKTDATPDSESIISVGKNFQAEDDNSDDDPPAFPAFVPSDIDPRNRPSSFGISFALKKVEQSFKICVTWGTYSQGETGKRKTWKRTPHHFKSQIEIDKNEKIVSIYEGNDGKILLYIRKISDGEYNHIILNIVNNLTSEECNGKKLTEKSIFQPSIRIKVLNGIQPLFPEQNKDVLRFLYRNRPAYARGYFCSAIWKDIDYSDYIDKKILWPDGQHFRDECLEFFSSDVRSEFVPLYPDPTPSFEWNKNFGEPPELSAFKLSEMWKEDVDSLLSPLADAYEKWVEENENVIKNDKEVPPSDLIKNQKLLLKRLREGIKIIKDNEQVRLSFCFANRVIWLQNKWKKTGEDFIWRPFQLAFIIIVLRSLTQENSDFRDYIDLLWVPTGGGKTETYLALMAFIIALRRTKMTSTEDKTGYGVAVITRYTLRLLTVQQFRRTLRMVTAAEYLRVLNTDYGRGWRPKKCKINKDLIFGSLRFSIGLWVGGSVSPNFLRKPEVGAIDAIRKKSVESDPAQVIRCPVCGTYLSVPESGLPIGEKLFLLIQSDKEPEEIKNKIFSSNEVSQKLKDISIKKDHTEYMTLILTPKNIKLREDDIDKLWQKISDIVPIKLLSLRASRPGYFGCRKEPGRKRDLPRDFEIYCPNPDCELNNGVHYTEGVPLNSEPLEPEKFLGGLVERHSEFPFSGHKIPIPAYTVDEQIYHRCPSIIVSTADKIARLAFEPRAASIFGNVNRYNSFYGYYRDELLPVDKTVKASDDKNSIQIKPFLPPDLIVQDELHLMEGPLGSMFGLYENAVEALMKTAGNMPKYIASTATIKDASVQVERLFARKLFQFPPYGIKIEDTFFFSYPPRKDSWDEETPGRLYLGICTPGMAPLTPMIRIWSTLLKTGNDFKNSTNIKYFWTVVGYFNAIRELGGAEALYREDIIERLKQISSGNSRIIDPVKVVELSSRINSTDISDILDNLENGERKELSENPDAIFTTSMFGTGVDIPHLSLMVVDGQPKTTTQYIQATGRVGRKHGGLIITFLRASRPRDLSHYEMFASYHQRIYSEVEPSSVSPFSVGTMAKGSGPVLVSFLRNKFKSNVNWYGEDGKVILNNNADKDITEFIEFLSNRNAQRTYNDFKTYFKSQADKWKNLAHELSNQDLIFVEYTTIKEPSKNVVLGDPHHERLRIKVVFRNAPQSLRDVEETTGFGV